MFRLLSWVEEASAVFAVDNFFIGIDCDTGCGGGLHVTAFALAGFRKDGDHVFAS